MICSNCGQEYYLGEDNICEGCIREEIWVLSLVIKDKEVIEALVYNNSTDFDECYNKLDKYKNCHKYHIPIQYVDFN